MAASPSVARPASELAALVAAEARLDHAIADARAAAAALVDAAHRRIDDDSASIDAEIERERERIAGELDAATRAEVRAIDETARAAIARYDAVRGEAAAEIARVLADELAAEVAS